MSLLGAATLTLGILLLRQQRPFGLACKGEIPEGEEGVRSVSLERLRELGF